MITARHTRALFLGLLAGAVGGCGTRYVDLFVTLDSGTPSDAGVMSPAEAATPFCAVVPVDDTRCLACMTPTGATMACLKCDAPVKTSDTGDYCRACGWSDLAGRCLQCFTADGTATLDDCDQLRAPSPVDAGVPSKTGASG